MNKHVSAEQTAASLLYAAAACLLLCSSCSLNYGSEEDSVTQAPEFVFSNLQMTRVEQGKTTAAVKAMQLEQYRDEDAMYAKAVSFKLYNDEGKISVEGSCGMLSADSESDIYLLFSNVEFNSYEQNMKVLAHNIRWDNTAEQLVCGKDDIVNISSGMTAPSDAYAQPQTSSKIEMFIDGSGFSASGASMSYVFSGSVSGTIITGRDKKNMDENNESVSQKVSPRPAAAPANSSAESDTADRTAPTDKSSVAIPPPSKRNP